MKNSKRRNSSAEFIFPGLHVEINVLDLFGREIALEILVYIAVIGSILF